jgi:Tfp pilus assembly PilM family ATPase
MPDFGSLSAIGPKEVLCFDFITEAVKVARLKAAPSKKVVSELYYKDVRSLGEPDIVKTLKGFLDQSARREYTAIATVPANLVITKNIEIPSQDPKEIKDIINLQAGRLTPYSRDEVIIDYIHIGVFRQSYTKLLLVIVNKDIVQKQLALFSEAGINITKIVLSSEAIASLVYGHLKLEIQDSPFCVIHTDATLTDFGVFLKEKQIFLRSISIGSHHLLTDKEKYLNRFIEELKKSLDAYNLEDIESSPTHTVFTGAIDGLKDLEVMMLDAFRMPVRLLSVADFIPKADYIAKETLGPREVSMLGVAAPLFKADAGGINLIPDEVKLRLSLEERGRQIIKTGAWAMTIFLFVCGIFLANIYFKTEFLQKLNAKFKLLNAEASQIEKDFSKVKIIRNYLSNRGRSLEILTQLYDLTPLEIALTNIRLKDNGSFSVRGEASAMSAVFIYVNDLEKSSCFKNVKTKYTSKRKDQDREIVDFEVLCALEGPAEEPS